MTSLKDIRKEFLGFFDKNDHAVVSSSPLVPQNDPTLLFTNAGMVQFKNVFTGAEKRDYTRAASSQKVVRAGGKHNDLDNVGYTARHLTFFEMLGNFSFGDYFKEEAIAYAWELLRENFGLPKDRLIITVYSEDDEAFDIWRKMTGFSESQIIRIPTSDNFWSMGDTGPCGPCSEIFFDHGEDVPGGLPGTPEEDGDRFVEVWNLVFMQFEQLAADKRVDLPKPSIDTGMGLERFATVLQGVHTVFDTDMFQSLISQSADLTGTSPDGERVASHRVIADHLRSACFLIADGVLPSNEGRGYVLRRIMRRGMRHAHILGAKDPLMYRLVPQLVTEMGEAFPELGRAQALMTETLKLEEERFRVTLERGLKLLDDEVGGMGEGDTLSGEVAFKLYDTYGFPVDLTEDALRVKGIGVDSDGFNAAMAEQKAAARAAWKGSGEAATEQLWFDLHEELGATEFLGYENEQAEGLVTAVIVDGELKDEAGEGEVIFVANQTPFYGESGGQVGDKGIARTAGGAEIEISDTQKKLGELFVHYGKVTKGTLKKGDSVEFAVDHGKRTATRANHSATHLLHEALRRVLGDHVSQKGSYVDQERLRFDFSHPKAVSKEEAAEIERQVNDMIRRNDKVSTRVMTPDDAIEAGALALFGEKYGDEVRVLTMGTAPESEEAWREGGKAYSVELCGGTHVERLGDIGVFKIIGESAVAAGVRRIEGLAGECARLYLNDQLEIAQSAAEALKTKAEDVPQRISALLDERKRLEKDLTEARRQLAMGGGSGSSGPEVKEIGGVKFIGQVVEGVSPKDLPGLVDDSKQKLESGVAAFVCVNDGKVALAVGVTDDLTDRVSAVDLIRAGVEAVGGKGGGGRPDMARGGGPDGDKAPAAVAAIENLLSA